MLPSDFTPALRRMGCSWCVTATGQKLEFFFFFAVSVRESVTSGDYYPAAVLPPELLKV